VRVVLWLISLVTVAVLAVVGVGATGLMAFDNPFEAETTDRSGPALLVSIQDISEFHSAVGNFEVVLDVEKDVPYVPSILAGERSLFVAAGTVDAYVDFSGLSEGDLVLSEDGKSVEIRLPEPQLDEPNLDQDRTRLFSQERGVFDRVEDALSTPDQQEFYVLAEDKLTAAADESALRQQAEDNTKAMLVGFFKALDLTVTFVEDTSD